SVKGSAFRCAGACCAACGVDGVQPCTACGGCGRSPGACAQAGPHRTDIAMSNGKPRHMTQPSNDFGTNAQTQTQRSISDATNQTKTIIGCFRQPPCPRTYPARPAARICAAMKGR